jgi:biopolymer transport protein ExbB
VGKSGSHRSGHIFCANTRTSMGTILLFFREGGPFIAPLLIAGIAGVAVFAERISFLTRRSGVHARPFIEKIISLVRAGEAENALKLCADHQAALADLGLVILRSREDDERSLLDIAEAATAAQLPLLTRRTHWVSTLAWTTLLVGALGATVNLHDALGAAPDAGRDSALAFALRPLGAGIATAIPLFLGRAWLQTVTDRLTTQLEEFSARLVNAMLDRPDVRLGHRT